ncbi:MAG TPA: dienelactone hydrolase family protein [Geobacteraceae bacterium]|nr:dienelactone hydrolase family protein [Geobacteraceae bacterium]
MKTILGGLIMAVLIATGAQAEVRAERIEYKHGNTLLEGFLAYDDTVTGKRPGVLVVHEWWGLNDYAKRRAEQLARLGYVAFCLDMYGKGKVTADPKVAGEWAGVFRNDRPMGRARAAAGLEVLKSRPQVDPARIAAIGYCFGGTVVLEMARSGADLKGVVSFHGGLATPTPADARNIKGKVLVLHGADDLFEQPSEIAAFQEEMRQARVDWQMVYYGSAVHSFTNPESGKAGIKGVGYNEAADRRSWLAMRNFFDEIFK